MPGFAGFISFSDERPVTPEVTARMNSHFGAVKGRPFPIHSDDKFALFGVTEPKRTTQLIYSSTKQPNEHDAVISFVGDIVNTVELRNRLDLSPSGDEECDFSHLLQVAYQSWGIDVLCSRIIGRFALCVHDRAANHTLLGCDSSGTIPVFYCHRHEHAAFSTSMRALIASGLVNPKLNQTVLIEYLARGVVDGENTLLTGAKRLIPGHILDWSNGACSSRQFNPEWEEIDSPKGTAEVIETFRTALLEVANDWGNETKKTVIVNENAGLTKIISKNLASSGLKIPALVEIEFKDDQAHVDDSGLSSRPLNGETSQNTLRIDAENLESSAKYLAAALDEPTANEALLLYAMLSRQLDSSVGRVIFASYAGGFDDQFSPDASSSAGERFKYGVAKAQRDWIEKSFNLGSRIDWEIMPVPRPQIGSARESGSNILDVATIWNLLASDQRPSLETLASHLDGLGKHRGQDDVSSSSQDGGAAVASIASHYGAGLFALGNSGAVDCEHVLLHPRITLISRLFSKSNDAPVQWRKFKKALENDNGSAPSNSKNSGVLPLRKWMDGAALTWIRRTLLDGYLVSNGILNSSALEALFIAQREFGTDLAKSIWSLVCLELWYASILESFPPIANNPEAALDVVGIDPNTYLAGRLPDDKGKFDDVVDIVMPVYGGINYVKDAVRSILSHTDVEFRLIIVDDSDCDATFDVLQSIATWDARIQLLRNEVNLGFVQTANRGMRAAQSKFVCLINSDIIVTDGWLGRMMRCAESDARIAVVNPLSNMSVNLSVAMAPGLNLNTMSTRLSQVARRDYPDITTAVGYCMLIRRKWLRFLGNFDEIFGAGYCEESDFCMRITEEGLRIVAAEDAFVYHKGSGSFGTWIERYRKNRKIFDERWAYAYQRDYEAFLRRNPLQYIRDALLRNSIAADEWSHPISLAWDRFDRDHLARRGRSFSRGDDAMDAKTTAGALVRHVGRRPRTGIDPSHRTVRYPTRAYIDRIPDIDRMRITFLIAESMPICGGVICITQLAREMLIAGHDVKIATIAPVVDPEKFNLPLQPLVFPNHEELIRLFPPSDIVIATFWTTAYQLMPKLRRHYDFVSSYYVQDYEAYFYPEDEYQLRAQAAATYTMTEYRTVMSSWLKQLIERKHGVACEKIHMGLDLGVFRPRSTKNNESARPQIVYNARPDAPRRGFDDAVKAFKIVRDQRPDVEFVFFGTEQEQMPSDLPFPVTNLGRIYDPNKVAQMISDAEILLDSSHFQGFGRPGLEAMACGTPPVLTNEGGVNEYARDDQNCLMVNPRDFQGMAAHMIRLLNDKPLAQRLRDGGMATAAEYCHIDEARIHLEIFEKWLTRKYDAGQVRYENDEVLR